MSESAAIVCLCGPSLHGELAHSMSTSTSSLHVALPTCIHTSLSNDKPLVHANRQDKTDNSHTQCFETQVQMQCFGRKVVWLGMAFTHNGIYSQWLTHSGMYSQWQLLTMALTHSSIYSQ